MKLYIGDIHLKKSTVEVVGEVLEKCRKLATKCTETIFMGDVNDTKAVIRSEAQTLFMGMLADWPTPVIVLIGNHDLHNSLHPEDGHSLEVLKLLPNVTVVDKPMVIGDTFYVPYLPEDQFKKIELKKAEYLCIHQDIDNLRYSSHPNQKPIESGLTPKLFSQYKRVFGGHIHLAQEVDNVIILGTPYTESYKEANDAKRVIVFNPEKDKVMSVPMNVRRHLSFEYTIQSMEDIRGIKDDLKTKVTETDLVRVVINTPPEIEHKIKKSLFRDSNIDGLKTKRLNTIVKDLNVTESMNNVDVMERYFSTVQASLKVIEALKLKNREILTELHK